MNNLTNPSTHNHEFNTKATEEIWHAYHTKPTCVLITLQVCVTYFVVIHRRLTMPVCGWQMRPSSSKVSALPFVFSSTLTSFQTSVEGLGNCLGIGSTQPLLMVSPEASGIRARDGCGWAKPKEPLKKMCVNREVDTQTASTVIVTKQSKCQDMHW